MLMMFSFLIPGYDIASDRACLESQGQVVHFGEGIAGWVADNVKTVAIANAYEVMSKKITTVPAHITEEETHDEDYFSAGRKDH